MAIAAAIRDHEGLRFHYRDDQRLRSSRTDWSAGSDAGISSPATPRPVDGRASGWTGCGCASPAAAGSPRDAARRRLPGLRATHDGVRWLARACPDHRPRASRGGAGSDQSHRRGRRERSTRHRVLVTGADSVEAVAVYIGMLGMDFTVTDPPELVAHLTTLAKRYAGAVRRPTRTSFARQ